MRRVRRILVVAQPQSYFFGDPSAFFFFFCFSSGLGCSFLLQEEQGAAHQVVIVAFLISHGHRVPQNETRSVYYSSSTILPFLRVTQGTNYKERKKEGENTDQTDGILVVQVELVVWEEILYSVQLVYLLLAPFHQLKQQQTNTKLRICF